MTFQNFTGVCRRENEQIKIEITGPMGCGKSIVCDSLFDLFTSLGFSVEHKQSPNVETLLIERPKREQKPG